LSMCLNNSQTLTIVCTHIIVGSEPSKEMLSRNQRKAYGK